MNAAVGLAVIAAGSLAVAWAVADVLVHAPSSRILAMARRWSDARYARKWGLPADAFDPAVQARVALVLRADAVATFDWAAFAAAHEEAA